MRTLGGGGGLLQNIVGEGGGGGGGLGTFFPDENFSNFINYNKKFWCNLI